MLGLECTVGKPCHLSYVSPYLPVRGTSEGGVCISCILLEMSVISTMNHEKLFDHRIIKVSVGEDQGTSYVSIMLLHMHQHYGMWLAKQGTCISIFKILLFNNTKVKFLHGNGLVSK